MFFQLFFKKRIAFLLIFITINAFIAFFAFESLAETMSSANYQVVSDSINVGGLDIGESANYNLKDTIGEISGNSSSPNFNIYAGYRQMDESYISLTVPEPMVLAPDLGGLSGGKATSSGLWKVETDSSSGYSLFIKATSSPALVFGSDSFADYTPGSAGVPDFDWNIETENSEFGYSPYNATSQADKFKNTGVICDDGINITDGNCWLGLSTSNEMVAYGASPTGQDGEDTKISFQAEINSFNGYQAPGTYLAGVVVTAICN